MTFFILHNKLVLCGYGVCACTGMYMCMYWYVHVCVPVCTWPHEEPEVDVWCHPQLLSTLLFETESLTELI